MAEYIVRNSLNPHKVVKCGVTFRQVVSKDGTGDPIWLVEVATDEPHKNGGDIPSVFVNLLTLNDLDSELKKATETISAMIDWSPLYNDTRAPIVTSCYPSSYYADIQSNIEIVLSELLPAGGIDINTITMEINGWDVTNELDITGDPYEYNIKWEPSLRIFDTYD